MGSPITKYSNFPNEKGSCIYRLFWLVGCCSFHFYSNTLFCRCKLSHHEFFTQIASQLSGFKLNYYNLGIILQVGSWRPEPGIRHYHVSLNENETVRWVGDFAEIIKCHNPGATGPHKTEPLPRLKVTTFLVRTRVHTLLALLENTCYRTIFCVFVTLKATGHSSQMSKPSNFLSY